MNTRLLQRFVVALSLLWSVQAKADPMLEDGVMLGQGFAIELGLVQQFGLGEFSSTVEGVSPNARGLVLKDRHGTTARVIMAAIIVTLGAMAAASPKSVESKTYTSGNYRITETTTTYRSPAEQQAMMAASAGAASGLFAAEMAEFELEAFSRDRFGFGDSSGYKLNMLFGGGSETLYFETGLGWGSVNSLTLANGVNYEINQSYLGMPFRIGGAISKVAWAATWEWNWAEYGLDEEDKVARDRGNGVQEMDVAHHPLRIDAQMGLFGRLYGQVGLVFPSVREFEFGYRASAGFRF